MDERDDAAVVAQCLGGDHNAYEVIVKRHQRKLFNLAVRLLGNYEDAQDATQSAFIKAYEHLDGFDRHQQFLPWIYRILKNECLNVLRARRPMQPVSLDLPASAGSDPVECGERHQAVQAALMTLSLEYREVVVLRHFTEMSYEDIGVALGIPAKTVKSRLYTARQHLGDQLAEWRVTR